MGQKFSPTIVGVFVLGALALGVLTVVVLGSGRLFSGKRPYILYFDRDVNGLRVGAPVKFRGVDIGEVTAIQLSLNGLDEPGKTALNVRIPVLIVIDSRKIESHKAADDLSDPSVMKHAVALGLRGQLQMQSFVTNVLYVDLDMHPGTQLNLERGGEAGYDEIPTLPTALEEAQEAASKIIAALDRADLPGLIKSFTATAKQINAFVQSPQLKASIVALGEAAKTTRETSRQHPGAGVEDRCAGDSHESELQTELRGRDRRFKAGADDARAPADDRGTGIAAPKPDHPDVERCFIRRRRGA